MARACMFGIFSSAGQGARTMVPLVWYWNLTWHGPHQIMNRYGYAGAMEINNNYMLKVITRHRWEMEPQDLNNHCTKLLLPTVPTYTHLHPPTHTHTHTHAHTECRHIHTHNKLICMHTLTMHILITIQLHVRACTLLPCSIEAYIN